MYIKVNIYIYIKIKPIEYSFEQLVLQQLKDIMDNQNSCICVSADRKIYITGTNN